MCVKIKLCLKTFAKIKSATISTWEVETLYKLKKLVIFKMKFHSRVIKTFYSMGYLPEVMMSLLLLSKVFCGANLAVKGKKVKNK